MKIALSGYYGCGNTGDEAVLAGIKEAFTQRAPGKATLTVLSANPADTEHRHELTAVDRMKSSVLRSTIGASDLLISGGGSLLQDTTSVRSLLYYLWVMRIARKRGTPFMLYAQGIGPLNRSISRILTRIVVNHASYITVRDDDSAELLRKIGVLKPQIEVTADPAFALKATEPIAVRNLLKTAGVDAARPMVGIALRPWLRDESAIPMYAQIADGIAQNTGAQVVFLPFQPPGDLELSERIAAAMSAKACVVHEQLSPCDMLGVIHALTGLVAMRLHALIFGAMGGVPMVALGYDPKVHSLMAGLGQADYTVDTTNLSERAVLDKLKTALANKEAICAVLRAESAIRAERALVNVDRALATRR